MLNERKVLFVVCANNDLYLEECLWYISRLKVPNGIRVETISIRGTERITQAYNKAMHSSDAKYKIYLHQDVFIYNENFIEDMLRVFQAEARIGMLGMIGGNRLSDEAKMWNSWNLGRTFGCNYSSGVLIELGQEKAMWTEAIALDGMLLATQYDLEWRDDLGMTWDGYDISQSLEFKRRGYLLVIPYQETPWCMHDCGPSDMSNYDYTRKLLMKEYCEYFSGTFLETNNKELGVLREKLLEVLKQNIVMGRYDVASELLNSCNAMVKKSKGLRLAINILDMCMKEQEKNSNTSIILKDIYEWTDLVNKYNWIKFMLRRVESKEDKDAIDVLYNLKKDGLVSDETLRGIAKSSLMEPEKLYLDL